MADKKVYTVPFMRKLKSRTDYGKRLTLLKSRKLRLVVRKSNKHILAQLIKYGDKGDIVLKSAHSKELAKLGWNMSCGNLPAAYLVGLMIGKKAKGQEAILDLGLQGTQSGSLLYAVLKGAVDAGLKIPYDDQVIPEEGRLSGSHISDYAKKLKDSKKDEFEKLFSGYLNNKKDPEKIKDYFDKTKAKILS
ncbi:50S ribosomal protein L18 [Candidatus Woesearchaeota archaeon]|nr:50S ribosomal protein L18 [Candidatus Woesearchaeota archaeon]